MCHRASVCLRGGGLEKIQFEHAVSLTGASLRVTREDRTRIPGEGAEWGHQCTVLICSSLHNSSNLNPPLDKTAHSTENM